MFLQASVILLTGVGCGVCLSACWDARPPPPTRQTPSGTKPPLGPGRPPGTRQTPTPPPDQVDPPPGPGRHPPEADASIRSMSGRYASYWNAFLSTIIVEKNT